MWFDYAVYIHYNVLHQRRSQRHIPFLYYISDCHRWVGWASRNTHSGVLGCLVVSRSDKNVEGPICFTASVFGIHVSWKVSGRDDSDRFKQRSVWVPVKPPTQPVTCVTYELRIVCPSWFTRIDSICFSATFQIFVPEQMYTFNIVPVFILTVSPLYMSIYIRGISSF